MTATNCEFLLALARLYVRNLPPSRNVFSSTSRYLRSNPWEAATQCTSFLNLLEGQCFDGREGVRLRAKDRYVMVERGEWSAARNFLEVPLGACGFIEYEDLRDGFTGHTFIVAGKPYLTGEMIGAHYVMGLSVIDSCRSSHGRGDSRHTLEGGRGGIGSGTMRFVVDSEGEVHAYIWSGEGASEIHWCGKEQKILFGVVPESYSRKKGVIHG